MTDPCSAYRKRLHLYLDGEVASLEAQEIETHLAACHQCQTSLEEMRSMDRQLRAELRDFVDGDRPGGPDRLAQTIERVMREPPPRWRNAPTDSFSGRSRRRGGQQDRI